MLTLQTEGRLLCPSCGNLIVFDQAVNVTAKNAVDCPHCGDSLFLSVTVMLLSTIYIRSNAAALAEIAATENDLLADIDAEIAEEQAAAAADTGGG